MENKGRSGEVVLFAVVEGQREALDRGLEGSIKTQNDKGKTTSARL